MAITLISTVTVGAGGAASIDFTSIPGIYTDLMLVHSGRSTSSGAGTRDVKININGTGIGTNISNRILYGDGSSAASVTNTTAQVGFSDGGGETANTFGNNTVYFPNYAGSTNKSFSVDAVFENNATFAQQMILAGLWSNTAAISSISLSLVAGNFAQYSSASLYGITKGSSGGVTVA